ncbi:MAG TPA: hypothetical protein VGA72_04125, partial [Anaerolineales bacterium]
MAQTNPQQRGRLTLNVALFAIIVLLTLAAIVFNRQASASTELARRNAVMANTAQANAEEAQQ